LSDTFVERQSRMVSLVYQVLWALELPPLEASEGEVLVVLASAFHHKAQIAVQAELENPQRKPELPTYTRIAWSRSAVAPLASNSFSR
jgi:hypothetical protein